MIAPDCHRWGTCAEGPAHLLLYTSSFGASPSDKEGKGIMSSWSSATKCAQYLHVWSARPRTQVYVHFLLGGQSARMAQHAVASPAREDQEIFKIFFHRIHFELAQEIRFQQLQGVPHGHNTGLAVTSFETCF